MNSLDSPFGYVPNLPANVIGAVLFGLILLYQLWLGVHFKEYLVMLTWGLAALLEFLTYVARSVAHHESQSIPMYEMQLICGVIAPAFVSRGTYYQLSKLVTIYGERFGVMPPRVSVWFFIIVDICAVVVQAAGSGTTAANVGKSASGASIGRWVVVAGIAFQTMVMVLFLVMWVTVLVRIHRSRTVDWNPKFESNRHRKLFPFFVPAITLSHLFILIRSIFRIVEMAEGIPSKLTLHERYFLVLDGLMVLLGMLVLCVVYPRIAYGHVPINGIHKPSKADDELELTAKFTSSS